MSQSYINYSLFCLSRISLYYSKTITYQHSIRFICFFYSRNLEQDLNSFLAIKYLFHNKIVVNISAQIPYIYTNIQFVCSSTTIIHRKPNEFLSYCYIEEADGILMTSMGSGSRINKSSNNIFTEIYYCVTSLKNIDMFLFIRALGS